MSKVGRKKRDVQDIFDRDLCKRIRTKLKLMRIELDDTVINKVITEFNKDILRWVINNADGYKPHRRAGNIVVSKNLPYYFKDNKEEKLEDLLKTTTISDWKKRTLLKRYKEPPKKFNLNTFFYNFRILWFNHRNCDFKKAELYRFENAQWIKPFLGKKIREGKNYIEWKIEDFKLHGEQSVSRRNIIKFNRIKREKEKTKDNE